MEKVGILRGPSLNPYEGQYFEKLKKFGFQPVGIATFDAVYNPLEMHFPVRTGHSYSTLTKGKFRYLLHVLASVTKYDFRAYNYFFWDLKSLTADLSIIHSADTWYPYTYQAVKTKVPTVVTEWETIPFNHNRLPFSRIQRFCRENVAHFVAITEKAKKSLLIEGVHPNQISVVPAGIDCDRFQPAGKEPELIKEFGISKDSFKILFVGGLISRKGIFFLLDAFSTLLKSNNNIQLIVVGSGSPKVRAQIAKQISDNKMGSKVRFLGRIGYSLMPKIHNLADAFCLPSVSTEDWEEQFGFSIVEAMACAKPVVSTFSGSIPEIVRDHSTGLLVKPSDAFAIKSALETLIADEKTRKTLGKNGRQWVLQRFEANKVANQLADIYRNCL